MVEATSKLIRLFCGDLYNLTVEPDRDGDIANGDIVTVSVSEYDRENLAHMGYAHQVMVLLNLRHLARGCA